MMTKMIEKYPGFVLFAILLMIGLADSVVDLIAS